MSAYYLPPLTSSHQRHSSSLSASNTVRRVSSPSPFSPRSRSQTLRAESQPQPHHSHSHSLSQSHTPHHYSPVFALKQEPYLPLQQSSPASMHPITLPTPVNSVTSPQMSRPPHYSFLTMPVSSSYAITDPRRLSSSSGTSITSNSTTSTSYYASPGSSASQIKGLGIGLGVGPTPSVIPASSSPSSSPKLPELKKIDVLESPVSATTANTNTKTEPNTSSTSPALPFAARRKTPSSWDPHDDFLLRHLKEQRKLGWKEIALHFPNRTTNACQFRWRRLVSGTLRSAPASTKFGQHKFNNTTGPGPEFFPAHLAKSEDHLSPHQHLPHHPHHPPNRLHSHHEHQYQPNQDSHQGQGALTYNYAYGTLPAEHQSHTQHQTPPQPQHTYQQPIPAVPLPLSVAPLVQNQNQYHGSSLPPLNRIDESNNNNVRSRSRSRSDSEPISSEPTMRSPVSAASPASSVGSSHIASPVSKNTDSHNFSTAASWTQDQDDLLVSRSDLRPEELSLLLGKPEAVISARVSQLKHAATSSGRRPDLQRKVSGSHFNGLRLPIPIVRR